MTTLGLELCDVSLRAAKAAEGQPIEVLETPNGIGALLDWPGFIAQDARELAYGRTAEGVWHVHPRKVCHNFLDHLSREASPLAQDGKFLSYSQLSYFFLGDFNRQVLAPAAADRVVLAVPGAYLKDATTEEEKIGLLLGMSREIRWPLAAVTDMACAALCDPRLTGLHASWPVVVLDVHLHSTEITLFMPEGRLRRADFVQMPQLGLVQFFKQATTALGNRFLRHTAFDILADGRLEQAFYRQVKEFILSRAPEFHFQINTAKRAYEMNATREQLRADAQPAVTSLLGGITSLLGKHGIDLHACTLAMTARAAAIPGLDTRLRQSGLNHILRLPQDAAAYGAVHLGTSLPVPDDISDVPVITAVELAQASLRGGALWEARLHRANVTGPRNVPTHVIIEGIGHPLLGNGKVSIGAPGRAGVDVALPEPFKASPDCVVQLMREGERLWFDENLAGGAPTAPAEVAVPAKVPVEAGDRMVVRLGEVGVELLFAACRPGNRPERGF
jgi:hypothetical protein